MKRVLTVSCSFHCLFCDGYEERDAESVGLLAGGLFASADAIAHVTPMARRLSKKVTIYSNGNSELLSAVQPRLPSRDVHYDDRRIARFSLQGSGPQVRVTFEDGSSTVEGFLVNHPRVEQAAPFAAQLGLDRLPSGEVRVEPPFNETSLAGCFAAGDNATPMKSAVQAIHMGSLVGVGMTMQLGREV